MIETLRQIGIGLMTVVIVALALLVIFALFFSIGHVLTSALHEDDPVVVQFFAGISAVVVGGLFVTLLWIVGGVVREIQEIRKGNR